MSDTHGAQTRLGLHDMCRHLSSELLDLQELSLGIEKDFHEAIESSGARYSGAAQRRLQELDRLSQTLGCLGAFLNDVSDAVPEGLDPDIGGSLGAIHLPSVAARLAHGKTAPRDDGPGESVELFD